MIAKAHELGLMNVHIPEAYGGLELGAFEGMLIGEELCWGCSGIGSADRRQRRWATARSSSRARRSRSANGCRALVEEGLLTSFALTEPNAGSDVSGIQTTAVRDGDDYVLNGSKMFITNAGYASWFTVFASTDKSKGHRGLTCVHRPG